MPDFLLDPGVAIAIALAVALAVWLGLFALLWRLDRQTRELHRLLDVRLRAEQDAPHVSVAEHNRPQASGVPNESQARAD